MADIIYFEEVRASFPFLADAMVSKKFPNSPPMFSIDIVDISPDHPKLQEFMQRYASLATATWGATAPNIMQMIQTDKRSRCFGMGPEKVNEETFQPLKGYGQGVWLNAKSKTRPQMINADGKAATSDIEAVNLARKIYGGCYVNVAIKPWLRLSNKGISAELIAIQFAKDGDPFGEAAVDAAPLFGAVASAPAAAMPGVTMPAAPFPSFLGQA